MRTRYLKPNLLTMPMAVLAWLGWTALGWLVAAWALTLLFNSEGTTIGGLGLGVILGPLFLRQLFVHPRDIKKGPPRLVIAGVMASVSLGIAYGVLFVFSLIEA